MMVVQMVYSCNFCINVFPPSDGVSHQFIPRELLTRQVINYNQHWQLKYSTYAQVHEEHENTMHIYNTGSIVMCPIGNAQGSYYFYILDTGKVLNQNQWMVLTIPANPIQSIVTLASTSAADITFDNWHGLPYDNLDYVPDPADTAGDDDKLDASIAGVD